MSYQMQKGGSVELPSLRTLLAIRKKVARVKFLRGDRFFCFISICPAGTRCGKVGFWLSCDRDVGQRRSNFVTTLFPASLLRQKSNIVMLFSIY